eukprot:scaffold244774_cov37-Prasinocladus_malaysianus.AAC.1
MQRRECLQYKSAGPCSDISVIPATTRRPFRLREVHSHHAIALTGRAVSSRSGLCLGAGET